MLKKLRMNLVSMNIRKYNYNVDNGASKNDVFYFK